MQLPPSPSRTTTIELDPDVLQPAICPLCHTTQSFALPQGGAEWQCGRCGQRWDAARLATVAEYVASVVARGTALRTA
jgi:hypothetical protein